MLYPMSRTTEEIAADSPCIGTCILDLNNICVGCGRHIEEIMKAGLKITDRDMADKAKKG